MPTKAKLMPDLTEPAKIGENLTVDAVIDRETTFDSEVTTNPVEDGFEIADHVTRKAITLSLTVVFTPTPVTWLGQTGTNQNRLPEVARALREIYQKADPVTVTLPDAIYENMVMTHAPLPRNVSDGYCYKMQLDFVQVRRVNQKTAVIDENNAGNEVTGKAGESEKDGGAASQTNIGTGMTVRDNTATIEVDTSAVDMSNAGKITTNKELTAHAAAVALGTALVAGVVRL